MNEFPRTSHELHMENMDAYQREMRQPRYPNDLMTGLTEPIFTQSDRINIRRDSGYKKLAALEKRAAQAEDHNH